MCSREMIRGISSKDGLTVSMLPHHLFQRLPMQVSDVFVKHMLSPKEQHKKMEMFASTGCLFLNPDWDNINYDCNSLHRIAADM